MKSQQELCSAIFEEHNRAMNFKNTLGKDGLFEQIRRNERFYSGDQWRGTAERPDRPTVRHNVIKRIGQYKMAAVGSSPVSVNYSADGVPNTVGIADEVSALKSRLAAGETLPPDIGSNTEINLVMTALSDYYKTTAERIKLDDICNRALKNAYISGTGIVYTYWDGEIKTGLYADEQRLMPITGDITSEVLNIENVDFGDPYEEDIQRQPYIIIAQQKSVDEIADEARIFGRTEDEISLILPDDDFGVEVGSIRKATVLTRLYKVRGKNGDVTVKAVRVCRGCVIRDEWDLNIRIYPLAKFCWEHSGGAYGESEITYLIPNQVAINRMLAAEVWSATLTGMPIMMVNGDLINQDVTNQPGQIIRFHGAGEDFDKAIKFISPPDFTENFSRCIDSLISNTLAQSGANEAALGDITPDNASAIIAVREAAMLPITMFSKRYYSFIEDIARIFAEFWVNMYSRRSIKICDKSGVWYMPFNGEKYRDLVLNARVDVGASNLWSESQTIRTLDNLYQSKVIDSVQYLERLPSGVIPNVNGLIREIKNREENEDDI